MTKIYDKIDKYVKKVYDARKNSYQHGIDSLILKLF